MYKYNDTLKYKIGDTVYFLHKNDMESYTIYLAKIVSLFPQIDDDSKVFPLIYEIICCDFGLKFENRAHAHHGMEVLFVSEDDLECDQEMALFKAYRKLEKIARAPEESSNS